MDRNLAKHELVTLAVFLLGGETKFIHVEDIAIKANEIAPGRFTWDKYKDNIDKGSVSKRLFDARKPEKGGYLIGSCKKGWMLTEKGKDFINININKIADQDFKKDRMSIKERNWFNREKGRLMISPAYNKYISGQANSITIHEIERFFRINDYVRGVAKEQRITRILNTFRDDQELQEAIEIFAQKLKGE